MFLKSFQHLSLGNDVTSSGKNIVIVFVFLFQNSLHNIYEGFS